MPRTEPRCIWLPSPREAMVAAARMILLRGTTKGRRILRISATTGLYRIRLSLNVPFLSLANGHLPQGMHKKCG